MPSVFIFAFLSTNSPARSWTRSDPVSAQSILGSSPSLTGPVLRASDWPQPPSAGAARGSQPAFGHQPIWGTRLLWPLRRRWTAPPVGYSTGSPGRPGSKGHCSVPETAPWTTGGRERFNLIVRECTRDNNSISDTFHYSLLLFFPELPPIPLGYILFYASIHSFLLFSILPPPSLCRYLHSIRRRVQSASLCDLQGCQEEQGGTKQRRTQHGSRETDTNNWSWRTENTVAAKTQI